MQILHDNVIYFGEVQFYFLKPFGDELRAFALVSIYSIPNEHVLRDTHNALIVCRYSGGGGLRVVEAKSIISVVAMVPFPFLIDGVGDQFFVIEKIGLDVIEADNLDDNNE